MDISWNKEDSQETLFLQEDNQAVEQAANRDCAVSMLGTFQDLDPTRSSPKQAGLNSELALFWAGHWI